jgi:hypothetical protein
MRDDEESVAKCVRYPAGTSQAGPLVGGPKKKPRRIQRGF